MVLLRENNVSAAGIAHLADLLPQPLVSQVYLRANRIGDAGARSLATMLAVKQARVSGAREQRNRRRRGAFSCRRHR